MRKFKTLKQMLEEELDAIDPNYGLDPQFVNNLESALRKLRRGNWDFTDAEVEAIQAALDDVGELHRFAGTYAGYRDDDVETVKGSRRFGGRAYAQAVVLGVYAPQSGMWDMSADPFRDRFRKLTKEEEREAVLAEHLDSLVQLREDSRSEDRD